MWKIGRPAHLQFGCNPTDVFADARIEHLNDTTIALKYYGPALTDWAISVFLLGQMCFTLVASSGIGACAGCTEVEFFLTLKQGWV
jgi:hypothetical protein